MLEMPTRTPTQPQSRTTPLRGILFLSVLAAVAVCYALPQSRELAGSLLAQVGTRTAALAQSASRANIPTQTYAVQPGDTPKGVALKFGTDVETLITLNAEKHPEMGQKPMKFNAGWTILVPKRGVSTSQQSGDSPVQAQQPVARAVSTNAIDSQGGYFDYEAALAIVFLTNEERTGVGIATLTMDESLMELARTRAVEIVTDYSHAGLGAYCDTANICGENIAQGYANSGGEWFVLRWVNSERHHNNMLGLSYSRIGVGVYVFLGKRYAVQVFE